MKRRALRWILMLVLLTYQAPLAFSQCAMCRGSVESTVSQGDTSMAANLNLGILYLFFTPYILFAVLGYVWYRSSKRNARKIQNAGLTQR